MVRNCASEVRICDAPRNDRQIFPRTVEPRCISRDTSQGCFRTRDAGRSRCWLSLVWRWACREARHWASEPASPGKLKARERHSGRLVFFTFMPLETAIDGIGVALLFGIIAISDAEIGIEREPCAAMTVK